METEELPGRIVKPVEYGGFWIRLFAFLIDFIIVALINSVIGLMIGDGIYTIAISMMINIGYFVFFESGPKQATPGKMVLDLKVTSLDHQRISVPRALGRYFAKMLYSIPVIIGLFLSMDEIMPLQDQAELMEWYTSPEGSLFVQMGTISFVLMVIFYGMAGIHKRKQALHDRIVRTYVVKEPEKNPAEA